MSKPIEILVVDDEKNFATECVEFLQITCKIGATFALTAQDAKEKLKQFPIKILLLDYNMPVTGLDLFPVLKQIDPFVEIVFISSVATNDVLYEAEKYPFAAKISKGSCYYELPKLIPTLLLKYAKDSVKQNEVFYHEEKKSKLFLRHKVEYSICSYHVINKEYIFPDSWHTSQMICAGEKKKDVEEIDYEKIFNFSNNFIIECGSNIELKSPTFSTALLTQLENSIKSKYSERIRIAIKRIREISLSDKNDTEGSSIVARFYDFAHVYLQLKIHIIKRCSCCNCDTIIPITAYFPIPKVAYRIREYFDDGKEPNEIASGFYETGFSLLR